MDVRETENINDTLESLARNVWFYANSDDEKHRRNCPQNRVPTAQELLDWPQQCPDSFQIDYDECAKELPGEDPERVRSVRNDQVTPAILNDMHKRWMKIPSAETVTHPLYPLVKAWQERAIPVELDRRDKSIAPAPLCRITPAPQSPNLPKEQLPKSPGLVWLETPQFTLPGLDSRPEAGQVPALVAAAYRASSRKRDTRGAPLESRVFIESVLAVPTHARDGTLYELAILNKEVATDWLRWNVRANYRPNRKETGLRLQRVLEHVNTIGVPIGTEGGYYFPVLLQGTSGRRLKDSALFLVRLPPRSDVGAPIDRDLMRRLGAESGPAYFGYLSLCSHWDYKGSFRSKPHGYRQIGVSRIAVLRDDSGYLMDKDGELLRTKKGRPAKSNYHKGACYLGGHELNPERERYFNYGAQELVSLSYPGRDYKSGGAGMHKVLSKAQRGVVLIEQLRGCTIEALGTRHRDGYLPWRIMPYDERGIDLLQQIPRQQQFRDWIKGLRRKKQG